MFLSEPLGYKAHEIVFRVTRHFLQSSSQYVVTASENSDKNSFYWSHVPTEEIHFLFREIEAEKTCFLGP